MSTSKAIRSLINASIGLSILVSLPSLAQPVCDVVIPSGQYLVDGNQLGIKPGATICLAAGTRGPLRMTNIKGDQEAPVLITNQSGTVTTNPYEYSIAIENSSHIVLSGYSESEFDPYAIKLGGTLSIGQLSHHVLVENIEIYRARFAGMLIKTDPTCDPATWQSNFTMSGITIRNNFVHHTEEGEGMYVGYTGLSRTLMCNGVQTTVYPHKLDEVTIENNRLEYTAADGIQLNSVLGNSKIHNNLVYRTGVKPFSPSWQNTGIQVGGNNVTVSNNRIFYSGGNGMMLDGDGLQIINNEIAFAGENGIFARNPAFMNNPASNGEPHVYTGNTFIKSASYALALYATATHSPHKIFNNTIETNGALDAANRPKTFSYLNSNVLRNEQNNRHYIVNTQ